MHGSHTEGPDETLPGVELASMRVGDLDQVLDIEGRSFPIPLDRGHFLFELSENPCAINWVALRGDEVLGYACAWLLQEELKLNNVAVRPDWRRRGLGRWLLGRALLEAAGRGCTVAQLEVRPSNAAALRLYRALGFVPVGRRKGYYQREQEDAILMEARLV